MVAINALRSTYFEDDDAIRNAYGPFHAHEVFFQGFDHAGARYTRNTRKKR